MGDRESRRMAGWVLVWTGLLVVAFVIAVTRQEPLSTGGFACLTVANVYIVGARVMRVLAVREAARDAQVWDEGFNAAVESTARRLFDDGDAIANPYRKAVSS